MFQIRVFIKIGEEDLVNTLRKYGFAIYLIKTIDGKAIEIDGSSIDVSTDNCRYYDCFFNGCDKNVVRNVDKIINKSLDQILWLRKTYSSSEDWS